MRVPVPFEGFSIGSEPYVDQVNCPDAPIERRDMVVNDTSADAQIHNVTSEVAVAILLVLH